MFVIEKKNKRASQTKMNTRFFDDECRIAKKLQQETGSMRYYMDVPGNGTKPCFILDPHIIPQKWGANLYTNCTDLQSSLMGLDRLLNRDCIGNSPSLSANSKPIEYPTCSAEITHDSRLQNPAWNLRGRHVETVMFQRGNLQNHIDRPPTSECTRRTAKDIFKTMTNNNAHSFH